MGTLEGRRGSTMVIVESPPPSAAVTATSNQRQREILTQVSGFRWDSSILENSLQYNTLYSSNVLYVLYIWVTRYFQGDIGHHFEKQTKIKETRSSLIALWVISIKVRDIMINNPLHIFRRPLYVSNIPLNFECLVRFSQNTYMFGERIRKLSAF